MICGAVYIDHQNGTNSLFISWRYYHFLEHIEMLSWQASTIAYHRRLFTRAPRMRPDKKSITDEVWDDARVKSFLLPATPQGDR